MSAYAYKKLTANDFHTLPFQAHKQYEFISSSAVANSVSFINAKWTQSASTTWSSGSNPHKYRQIDHLFYKNFKRDLGTKFDPYHYSYSRRTLHESCNIIAIPVGKIGEQLRPKSLYISTSKGEFQEESYGNLIVRGTDTSEYITDMGSHILNIGPVKGFERYNLNMFTGYIYFNGYESSVFYREGAERVNKLLSYNTADFGDEFDDSYHFNLIKYKNVNFSERELFGGNKFPSIDFTNAPWDTHDHSNPDLSEIKIAHDGKFNFEKGDDFTITLWACVSQSAGGTSYLISKSITKTVIPSSTSGQSEIYSTQYTGSLQPKDRYEAPAYPFEVFVKSKNSTPHLFFRRCDRNGTTTAVSASFTTGSVMQHIACRVSDADMRIFINGLQHGSTKGEIGEAGNANEANLYIGNKGAGINNTSTLSGSLSQINIYSTALSDGQIETHYSSSNGSPYVGNIFTKSGFAVITHPHYVIAAENMSTGFNKLEFQGSLTIHEHEYMCTVDEHEFLDTLNPSARKVKSKLEENKANFATGSLFKPYVTTVGLYNEDRELLAIGKLGQPIRMSNETDTTFVVRWDS